MAALGMMEGTHEGDESSVSNASVAALSESSDGGDDSDAEDAFNVCACAEGQLEQNYQRMFLYRWQKAVRELCALLRHDVLLPMHPDLGTLGVVWTQLDEAVVLPSWHCAFRDCTAASPAWCKHNTHESGLWDHIWRFGGHKIALMSIIKKWSLHEQFLAMEEVAFTLYNEALAEMERENCPRLGLATDRRALLHLGEIFTEDNVSSLMCFVCGCKHICHEGYDKFGRRIRKGTIAYRSDQGSLIKKMFGRPWLWF